MRRPAVWTLISVACSVVIVVILHLTTPLNILVCGEIALFTGLAASEARHIGGDHPAAHLRSAPTPGARLLPRVGAIALACWAAFIAGNLVLNPLYTQGAYDRWVMIAGAAATVVVLPQVYRGCVRLATWFTALPRTSRTITVLLVVALSTTVQIAFAARVFRPTGFDSLVVLQSAQSLAEGTTGTFGLESDYFAVYPTNITLLMILWKLFSLLHAFGASGEQSLQWGAVMLNVGCLQVAMFFSFLATRRIAGAGAGIFVALLGAPFLLFSPWLSVPYTDIFGTPFPPVLLYLFLRIQAAQTARAKIILWLVVGFLGAIAFNIKPTGVFIAVGIVLVSLVGQSYRLKFVRVEGIWSVLRRPLAQRALVLFLVGAAFVGVTSSIKAAENASGVLNFDMTNNQAEFPATHFLWMGAGGDGGYSDADVNTTRSYPTVAQKSDEAVKGYVERVTAMGVTGYAEFLGSKALHTGADGTFTQWGEGGLTLRPFINTDRVSKLVQSYWDPMGENRSSLVTLWQALWLVVIAGITIPLVARSARALGEGVTVIRLTLVALLVYLLFFEARARYIYLYAPLFIAVSGITWSKFIENRNRNGNRVWWMRSTGRTTTQPVRHPATIPDQ